MTVPIDDATEWLETDGLGGFASGTTSGIRTRRYHGLLVSATRPPAGRVMLVAGVEAWVEVDGRRVALTSQRYADRVVHADGHMRVRAFTPEPWPTWTYDLGDGREVQLEVLALHERPATMLAWRLIDAGALGSRGVRLSVRPLVCARDFHGLEREDAGLRMDAARKGRVVEWRPREWAPPVFAGTNGRYEHAPAWYRRFLYEEETVRGLDCVEDLASPGVLQFELDAGEAFLVFGAGLPRGDDLAAAFALFGVDDLAIHLRERERARRATFSSPLHRAADAYVVRRGGGKTIIAGYPWFGDWGRDTFIALRGLCCAGGRLDDGRAIIAEWATAVADGMLPNRFPDSGESPEYNSVDAALWYVIAADEVLAAAREPAGSALRLAVERAIDRIVLGYHHGTRYGIAADPDGLLRAGVPGVQLTWMDAKVGDWVVTPRMGKPVEVQALWIRALEVAGRRTPRWAEAAAVARAAFPARFWNEETGCLHDVVDVDHRGGAVDAAIRPNQVFALGGLGPSLVSVDRTRRALATVHRELWTPRGLRTLAAGDPAYQPRYHGGVHERDGAYHQGTVWPWLAGPFVEAWLAAMGSTDEACAEARQRFLVPLRQHVAEAGLGHVSEILDAEPPHFPRGCPFQAWSLAELLRLEHGVLARPDASPTRAAAGVTPAERPRRARRGV